MNLLYYISIALLIALLVNDQILTRRVRKAVELGQLSGEAFRTFSPGSSPISVLVNLLRFGSISTSNAFFSPLHQSVHRQVRLQQLLGALLLGCIAAALIRGVAT